MLQPNTPLLLVDIQRGFVNTNSQHVLPVVQQLAEHWRALGWPIYMSQFTNHPDSQWERLIGWRRLESEEEIAIHPAVESFSEGAVVYRKRTYTCFTGTFLADAKASDWTDIVLCGIATDGCVLATAIDIFEFPDRKMRPIVVRDACASHAGDEVHGKGLHLLERFIGRQQVVDCAAIFNQTALDNVKS
jgi:nicotinamidase-related amidase